MTVLHPMSEAPKDGTLILLYLKPEIFLHLRAVLNTSKQGPEIIKREGEWVISSFEHGFWSYYDDNVGEEEVEGWIPLPDAPELSAETVKALEEKQANLEKELKERLRK